MSDFQPLLSEVIETQRDQLDDFPTERARRNVMAAFEARRHPRNQRWMLLLAAAVVLATGVLVWRGAQVGQAPLVIADDLVQPSSSVGVEPPAAAPSSTALPVTPIPTPRASAAIPTATVAPAVSSATAVIHPPVRWPELLREGKTDEGLARIGEGHDDALKGASADDLLLLAEAGMVAKDATVARLALDALLAEHPGSSQAAIANFYIGRLAMSDGRSAEAARAFRSYLRDEPRGKLAREAHGRLIEALSVEGRTSAARVAARNYVKLYPKGPHAPLAKRLLKTP